jgi:ribosome-associated heat shock protein Hsp15
LVGSSGKPDPFAQPKLRLDKWLYYTRFFKSRDLAAEMVEKGRLRLNAQRCKKPGHGVTPGNVLIFAQGGRVRTIRILGLAARRGPADEAQSLYVDLDPMKGSAPLE